MLAVNLWCKNRDGEMETKTFLCDSFEQDYRDGSLKLHFTNGHMVIDSDASDGFVVHRHSFGESDILYPLNPSRMAQRKLDEQFDEDEDEDDELIDLPHWLDELAETMDID